MNISRCLTLLFLLFVANFAVAQRGNPATADTVSLQGQFDEMLRVSSKYQIYKTVRRTFLDAFMANVQDSISGYTEEISRLENRISEQEAKIAEQATAIEDRQGQIGVLTEEKDSISLLGMPLSKGAYSLILWSAIIALLAMLLLALARMRLAVGSARQAQQDFLQVNEDLEKSRKTRLEVEQKLRRQLQDEINKRN
jgi:BMFP domain-containing protein YqiC